MKTNFLYVMMAAFVCLFAACSQEEIVSTNGQNKGKVNLSVKIPTGGPVARAADLDVTGHTMQCIMELVDGEGVLIAESRQVATVTNGVASFEFTKPSGDYTCLFWAEYLNVSGKSFYKTSEGLTRVAYDGNKKNELFNNKAADAFCGKMSSAGISTGMKITLKRPFARIAVAKTDIASLGVEINQFTASINGAQGYNVSTGKTDAAITLSSVAESYISIPADGDHAFFCFVFPANDAVTKPSNIVFSDSKDALSSKKTLSITAEQMKTMNGNTAINLKPESGGGSDDKMNVDITIDTSFGDGGDTPEPEEPTTPDTPAEAVKVGDYLYADGTWGTVATDAVAVVFALAEGDVIINYDGITFSNNTINGWAVSIKQSAKTKWTEEALTAPISGMTSSATQDDLLGYKNTKAAGNSHPAVIACGNVGASLSGNTSGWYIPAIGQFAQLVTNVETVNTKLAEVSEAEQISFIGTSPQNYWSSTFNGGTDANAKLYQYQCTTEGVFKARSEAPANNAGVVRPIVTF